MSFLDSFSRYNQIPFYEPDWIHTIFVTQKVLYYYKVKLFGLKNVGATYQKCTNNLLSGQLGRIAEVYIDGMVIKTPKRTTHIQDLEEVLKQVDSYNMRLNPRKVHLYSMS